MNVPKIRATSHKLWIYTFVPSRPVGVDAHRRTRRALNVFQRLGPTMILHVEPDLSGVAMLKRPCAVIAPS